MGLFDIFTKNKNDLPFNEYFKLTYSATDIYKIFIRSLKSIYIPAPEYISPIAISLYIGQYDIKYRCNNLPIPPKQYKNSLISYNKAMEIASEDGHADAAFVIGLFYDYGIKENINYTNIDIFFEHMDKRKASAYYSLAKARNSSLYKIYEYALNKYAINRDIPVSFEEIFAVTVALLKTTEIDFLVSMEKLLELNSLAFVLIIEYARAGSEYCMAFLATCLVNIVTCENYEENYPNMKILFGYSADETYDAGLEIIQNLYHMSKNGNKRADFSIQAFNLTLEYKD